MLLLSIEMLLGNWLYPLCWVVLHIGVIPISLTVTQGSIISFMFPSVSRLILLSVETDTLRLSLTITAKTNRLF